MIEWVDLLGGVTMAFKEALLVSFWVECVVMLLIGLMVGCPCCSLFFTMNYFIYAKTKKTKNTMSYCVIHGKKWRQDQGETSTHFAPLTLE
jgi:hypothetical protein